MHQHARGAGVPCSSLSDSMSSQQAVNSYIGEGGAGSFSSAVAINAVLEAVHEPETTSCSFMSASSIDSCVVCGGMDKDSGSD